MKTLPANLTVLLLAGALVTARAADHDNLEEGLPVTVEDAYPIGYMGREVQGLFRYEQTDDNEDRFVLEPRLEFGFAPNWQAKVSVPFYLGSADRTDSGNIGLEAFYNFNTEGRHIPALALSAGADLPTGKDSAGVDTTVKAILTRTLFAWTTDRVHLNAAWTHNAGARRDDREHLYHLVIGYSRRLDPDMLLVADVVRELERGRKQESNLVEIGLRRQVTPLTVLTIGAGAGFGDESPDYRLHVGVQQAY